MLADESSDIGNKELLKLVVRYFDYEIFKTIDRVLEIIEMPINDCATFYATISLCLENHGI